jgi:hypothetical protein
MVDRDVDLYQLIDGAYKANKDFPLAAGGEPSMFIGGQGKASRLARCQGFSPRCSSGLQSLRDAIAPVSER